MKLIFLALWLLAQAALAVDLSQLKPLETLSLQGTGRVSQIVFSSDQQSLATINPDSYLNRAVNLWNISTGQRVWRWTLPTPDQNISSLRFLGAEVIELRLSNDRLVRLNAQTGKQLGPFTSAVPTIEARLIQHLKPTPVSLSANPLVTASSSFGISAYSQQTTRITLVDTKSLRQVGQLEEAHGQVMKLEFSPDGQQLAVARSDGRTSLWDVVTRKKRFNLRGHRSHTFDALEWSKDGTRLLGVSNTGGANLWNTQTGTAFTSVRDEFNRVEVVTLDPSGQSIAFAQQGSVFTMRVSDGAITQRIGFEVSQTVFSSDGVTLCVASSDGRIRVYQRGLTGYEFRDELIERGSLGDMLVTADQRLVFQTSTFPQYKLEVGVYDLRRKVLKRFPLAEELSWGVTALTSERILIGRILFNIGEGSYDEAPLKYENWVLPLRPDLDRILYFSSNRQTLTMTKFSDGTIIWKRQWYEDSIAPQWSPSGALLASNWLEQRIIIVDAKTGATKTLINPPLEDQPEQKSALQKLMFSPNETMLLTTYSNPSQRSLRIFDLKTRAELPIPPELRDTKSSPEFTPDGRRLMVSTLEGLQFWGVPGKNVFGK